MKYGDMTLYPQVNTEIHKDPKNVTVHIFPRLNQAESHLNNLEPSKVMCMLIIPNKAHYLALRQLHRAHTEATLYITKFGFEDCYYKQVTLEIGDQKRQEGIPPIILVPALFTCLDPNLYDSVTNEVIG